MAIILTVVMLIALPLLGVLGLVYYRYLAKLLSYMKAAELAAWAEMGKPVSAMDFSPTVAGRMFSYLLNRDFLDVQDSELHYLGKKTRFWLLLSTTAGFILLISITLMILISN